MGKTITLEEIGDMLVHVVKHMATKEDIAEVKAEMDDKFFALHTQVNSIETQIREMKHDRLGTRVADLEEKVFGKSR